MSAVQEDAGLRARLVAVGVELLASDGIQALTLREIARRAGVSHGAPRRYFPTHVELLSAIAGQGFAELAETVGATLADGPEAGPRAQLAALGRAYLDFSLAHRGMFELMFRHDLLESNRLGLRESSLPLFGVLVDLVAQARPGSGTAPEVAAAALWANLHGIAQLWASRSLQLASGAEDFGPLLDAALDAHLGPDTA
ncbi:TetR/AcrR family transcriptional regulator [Streptomyces sp. NBC_01304]|uniref:TetR/AcrR family transcriptional regulator n=1 Tax=Streptomyces sp. NBC_01304 TaxID=2903818 RepID=UPI002E152A7F|nr:TetR/AcrR family transcriptional regulator [Streptomyces sp. NBC_01304]